MSKTTSLKDQEPETFRSMLTVVKIMFQDAKDADGYLTNLAEEKEIKQIKEAFEYAESWLAQHTADVERESQKKLLHSLSDCGEIHHSVYDYRLEQLNHPKGVSDE